MLYIKPSHFTDKKTEAGLGGHSQQQGLASPMCQANAIPTASLLFPPPSELSPGLRTQRVQQTILWEIRSIVDQSAIV